MLSQSVKQNKLMMFAFSHSPFVVITFLEIWMCVFELELNMLMGHNSALLIGGGTTKVDVKTIAKVGNKYQGGYQGIQGNPPPRVH